MKLYALDDSPYCAPVKAAIYAKGLDIEIAPPPGGLKSEAYRAASLTGTIPCLVLDDGTPLPESAVILDYLEDRFPQPPLRPAGAEARAHEALIRRTAESALLDPMVGFFHQLSIGQGVAAVAATVARFERGLDLLQQLLPDEGLAAGAGLSLADCVLSVALAGVSMLASELGAPGLIADRPKVAGYMSRLMAQPAIGRALGELQTAVAARAAEG